MKIFKIFFFSLLVLESSACSKEFSGRDSVPISLQASSVETRAYTVGEVNSEEAMREGSFGAVGYSGNAIVYGSGSQGVSHSYYTGIGWYYTKSSDQKKWGDNAINFYAYFPYDITTTTFASSDASGDVMTLSGWTDGADVMYARSVDCTREKQIANANGCTELKFNHAFTKIDKIHVTVPESSPLTFIIGGIEITNTHCETDGKVILSTSGEATYTIGATQRTRSTTFSEAKSVNKSTTGGVDLVTSDDNFFFFPVATDDIWDGTTTGTDVCKGKLTVHLRAKAKQGSEDVLKGEYVLGSATDYADIYLPVKSSLNTDQAFERAHKYTINFTLKQGVGYDKDGLSHKPIDFDVTVDEWTNNTVSVGQITVNSAEVTMASGTDTDNSVVINASSTSGLSATVTEGDDLVTAAIQQDTDALKKIKLVITRNGTAPGTAKILINDTVTNSMVTITVTLQ